MKNVLILALLSISMISYSQNKFSVGVQFTPNLMTYKSPQPDTQNILFENIFYNGGIIGEYQFAKNWAVSVGTSLSTYAIRQRVFTPEEVPPISSIIPSYMMNDYYHYINVPVAIQFQLQNIYLKAGANNKYLLRREIYKPNQELYSNEKPSDLVFLSEGFVGFGTMVNYGNWQIRAGMNATVPIKSPFLSVNMELGLFYNFGHH